MIELKLEESDYLFKGANDAIKFTIEGLTAEQSKSFLHAYKKVFSAEDDLEVNVTKNKFREKVISYGPSYDKERCKNGEYNFISYITRPEEMSALLKIMEGQGFEGIAQLRVMAEEFVNSLIESQGIKK